MREETAIWLDPMHEEAEKRGINIIALQRQATMPAAESGSPFVEWLSKNAPAGAVVRGVDWVRFGQLLRHQLGWDDAYPAYPDFPEMRLVP
jgi:hypothetical protein